MHTSLAPHRRKTFRPQKPKAPPTLSPPREVQEHRNPLLQAGHSRGRSSLLQWLQQHLSQHIIPFWTTHALDQAGGINTHIADDGTILSRNKFLWGQWRAAWVFARLYNRHGRDFSHLETALQIAEFAACHGWDARARGWRLIVDANGREVEGCTSIYTDGFAMYALGELFLATGEARWRTLAHKTADAVRSKLAWPHDRIPHSPYPVPRGTRVHGIPMLFSLKFAELGRILGDERHLEIARRLSDEVFDRFYQPGCGLIFERVAANRGDLSGVGRTTVVPGHAIENMWFQIEIAPFIGREARIPLACELIRRHLEFGWDEEFGGGILLAKSASSEHEIEWNFPDMKLWWPHTETLYALLAAWRETGELWCLDWYDRVLAHCFKHYCDFEHGEWRQKLNRNQTPYTENVVYPVKDPFHLPRSLMLQIETLTHWPD